MKLSLSNLKLTVAFIFILGLTKLNAQKKYPSLLWEITGNGLTKPSYLYGTMHVSNKVVYHLADSFFVALSSVNTVGLESNPDQWLKNMKEIGLLEKLNNSGYYNTTDFYNDAFKIDIPDNKSYADILAYDPDIINNLLYRNTVSKSEQEEATYIDLFIYKTGSKLDKKIVSLESFKTSLIMATKASTPDLEQMSYESKRNMDYFKIQNDITDSYRRGDLDALDSLGRLSYRSKNFQKYLIEDRNVILAHNIDSISKTGSLFSGIGAAHLPGENGVIELLRKMGYKLRPMANISTKKMLKEKDRIDELVKKLTASKQYAADSLFSFDLFDAPISLVNTKGFSFSLATDMANGTYYSISRQITYAPLFGYTADKMMLKIDSLLYENIPGKIISKKEIVTATGVKGFDIMNKTKKGDLQRYHIYVMDNEFIMIKVGGKGDYIKGAEITRFFNSIQFLPSKKTGSISFSPATKGFSATIPATYNYISNKKAGTQGVAESLFAHDKQKNTINGVIHYFYHDYNYLEEDTFELNLLGNGILKSFGYTTNQTRRTGLEQHLPCLYFSADNPTLNTSMDARIMIKGVHYYFAYTIYNTKNKPAADPFLSSFKLIDFKHINEMKMITDNDYNFQVMDEMVPEDRNLVEEALTGFYAEIKKEKKKKMHSTDFEYKSKTKTYYSPSSAEHINIDYEKFNDYDYRDPETFWDDVKHINSSNNTLVISKPVLKTDKGVSTYEFVLSDTASTNIIKRKYILKDGQLLCLSAVCDSVTGITGWTDSFFKTIAIKDSVISKPIFESKTAILLKNLSSADSSIRYSAKQSLSNNLIEKKSTDIIINYLKSPELLKLDEGSRATIIVQSGSTGSEKAIPVFKELYTTYEDSSYMQICIIKGLALLKTQNSFNTLYDLLKNKTPLTGDESNIQNVLDPLYDSLELCKNFFPGLFSLSTFEEYKVPVFKLFTDMVIRDIIPPAKYSANLPVLVSDASNEIKRYNASSNKASKDNYGEEEAIRLAEELAAQYSEELNNSSTKSLKKSYPSYSNMIENYAVVLAPFYTTNANVKSYFDKLFKVKNENTLLNIAIIATKNKIPVNDTLWNYFSKNTKTRLKLYNELKNLNLSDKFDKAFATQELFCKTKLESDIQLNSYDYEDSNTSIIEKAKKDSLSFLKKVAVKNNREQGAIYFFERYDFKEKTGNLAFAFVADKNNLTTQIEVLDTKFVNEVGKTTEESINLITSEFYFRNRIRYNLKHLKPATVNYGDYNPYGDYEE